MFVWSNTYCTNFWHRLKPTSFRYFLFLFLFLPSLLETPAALTPLGPPQSVFILHIYTK
ncbi:hypothetical protein K450DRAFT_258113 [Umbelopsis ramanniana AG]|uniref:Uncharacterized protein n=1 Tax=Umbelopsis ramanniana AG TaxID=1314678 RepID=A0AAD5H9C1_UMBRA|nr:uncharacterized protein K450DRAFT_258113 [Umbelopsis ramanniana AG]KAI8576210.1 hypothetical protein K450DRAFT_258113 [Umbelopsis ramanniana AG]